MQQVRTKSFSLHHAVLVEDALRDAMLDGFPSGRTGSICSADMCGDEVACVVVCRCSCVAIQIQFRFNPDSDPRSGYIRIYPDTPPENGSAKKTPFWAVRPLFSAFLSWGPLTHAHGCITAPSRVCPRACTRPGTCMSYHNCNCCVCPQMVQSGQSTTVASTKCQSAACCMHGCII